MQQETLELATTDELLDELQKRFTHLVVAGVAPHKVSQDRDAFFMAIRGGHTAAIGCARRAAATLEAMAVRDDQEDEDE